MLWIVNANEAVMDHYGGGSLGGSFSGVVGPGEFSAKEIIPVSEWLKQHKGGQGSRKGMARLANMRIGVFVAKPRSSPLGIGAGETITITYTYDSLYRLIAADYSDGSYYHYTYDSVGNRLTELTQAGSTSYVYDIANRLTSVNGVTYTWDNNGNLLSDGVNTYSYDHANRLASASGGGYNASYGYSGTGDRLRQTVNGVTTSYTLDLVAGLTQVLADGTKTYLYGNGRIAQYDSEAQYFLGDSLGSVRQMVNAAGEVNLAKGYEPYGSTLSSAGGGFTNYAFTGEWEDGSTGMVYLRARYYAPWQGRFLTRDTWAGNPPQPISFNAWIYAGANPIVRVDPSGDCWIQLINGENRWFPDDDPICKNATYWEPYTLEDEYSMYLSQQIGPCTTCHLGKEKSPGEGFWVSNSELLTFRINAAQTYYSGVMFGVCGSHPYAFGVCSTISGVLDTNIITSKPFSSYNEKVSFLLTGWLATIFHYGNQSCMRLPLNVGGIDPRLLKGAGPDDIRLIVPTNAIEGPASDGGLKWTWVDEAGVVREIRYHQGANPDPRYINSPSGYGSTIKFGQYVIPGQGNNNLPTLGSIDAQFVQQYGTVGASPHPKTGFYYTDEYGFVYLDDLGQIWPLLTNQTHIPGEINLWPWTRKP